MIICLYDYELESDLVQMSCLGPGKIADGIWTGSTLTSSEMSNNMVWLDIL